MVGRSRQFERMVGLVKRALCKSVGQANLAWSELEEVILDVETTRKENCRLNRVTSS